MRYLHKAKRSDYKQWIEGYLLFDEFDRQYRIIAQIRYSTGTHIHTDDDPRVDKNTICQCTGLTAYWTDFEDELHECNVWEYDLLEVDYNGKKVIAEVKYEGGMFILASNKFVDSYIPLFDVVQIEDECWVDAKVIGNIFDNQDLLEETSNHD